MKRSSSLLLSLSSSSLLLPLSSPREQRHLLHDDYFELPRPRRRRMISVPLHPSRRTNAKKKRAQTETTRLFGNNNNARPSKQKRERGECTRKSLSLLLSRKEQKNKAIFVFYRATTRMKKLFFERSNALLPCVFTSRQSKKKERFLKKRKKSRFCFLRFFQLPKIEKLLKTLSQIITSHVRVVVVVVVLEYYLQTRFSTTTTTTTTTTNNNNNDE